MRFLNSTVNVRRVALVVTSVEERGAWLRDFDGDCTRARWLTLYAKLWRGSCLTHVGREGSRSESARRWSARSRSSLLPPSVFGFLRRERKRASVSVSVS